MTPPRRSGLIWLPPGVLGVVMAVLWAIDPGQSFESLPLLTALDLTFSAGVGVAVAVLAGRSYVARGEWALLALCVAVLVRGVSGTLGVLGGDGGNSTITVHNLGMAAAGVVHLAGAVAAFRRPPSSDRDPLRPGGALALAVAAGLGFVGLVGVAVQRGWVPEFFVDGRGGTPARTAVLGVTVALLVATAALAWHRHRRTPLPFLRWYAPGLVLIAIGLAGVMVQAVHGSPLGWVARGTQYLGNVYLLIGAVAAAGATAGGRFSLHEQVIEGQRQLAEQAAELDRVRRLFEKIVATTPDLVYVYDLTEQRNDYINTRISHTLGYTPAAIAALGPELIGRLVHPDDLPAVAEDHERFERMVENEVLAHEVRFRHATGGYRWLLCRETVFERDANGRATKIIGTAQDVTAQREAEGRLRESEEKFRTLFERMDQGFCVVEVAFAPDGRAADYRLVEMNPAFERHTGMGGLAGRWVREAVPGLEEFWFDTYGRVARTGEPTRFEHAAGPLGDRWFDVYAFRLGGPGSTQVAILFTDISARKRGEAALRDSEAHFRSMADHAPTMLWVTDATGACTYLSEQWHAFTGRAPADDLGFGWLECTHPDDRRRVGDVFRDATARQVPFALDYRLRRHDGEYRWAVDAGRPRFEGGEFRGFVGTVTDMHDRRLAEEAARAAEGRFRTLADNTPALIWQTDDGGLMFINRHYLDFFGVPFAAVAGMGWTTFLHPDDRTAYTAAYLSAFTQRKGYEHQCRFRRQDGEYRWLQNVGTPHHSPDGAFVGFIGCSVDVTDIKRAEEALVESDRKKDEFLATLAHELRNPLAPLRSGLQVMKLAGDDGRAVERARAMMERQLEQMTHLIDDLMDLSRVSRGKIALQKTRLPIASPIRTAVDTSRPLIDQQGHRLTVDVPDEPVHVDGDSTRLTQVFANLLNNAAKYTDRGGDIRLTVRRDAGEVVVTVSDTGVGIPADMLPRVFDMFAQVDRSLEKAQGGLGIGLNIVRRLVEMHGGTTTGESGGHGLGSTFTVRLPAVAGVPADRQDNGVVERVEPARRRILVVDDNADGADSLAMMLRIMGHDTRTAHDGLEAVASAEAFRPDVILMDIGMPKLNGYDACRRIRERPWGQGVVLVAQTGWGQEDDRRKSQDAGFDFHMVKPVDPAALEKLLVSLPTAG